MHIKHQ